MRHPFPTTDFIGRVEEKVAIIRAGPDKNASPRSTHRIQHTIPLRVKVTNLLEATHSIGRHKGFPGSLVAAIEEVSH